MERRNVEARWTVSLKRYCSPTGAEMNEQPLPRIQRRASVSTEHRTVKTSRTEPAKTITGKQKRK